MLIVTASPPIDDLAESVGLCGGVSPSAKVSRSPMDILLVSALKEIITIKKIFNVRNIT